MLLKNIPKGIHYFQAAIGTLLFPDRTTLLLQKRSDHPLYPNLWGFPAGRKRLNDKTITKTLYREIFEETGIFLENIQHFVNGPWLFPTVHQDLKNIDFYFVAHAFLIQIITDINIRLDKKEHQNLKILPLSAVMKMDKNLLIPDLKETLSTTLKLS